MRMQCFQFELIIATLCNRHPTKLLIKLFEGPLHSLQCELIIKSHYLLNYNQASLHAINSSLAN